MEKISPLRLTYSVDGWVLGMFAAALLDVVTTYYFFTRKIGFESNPVAAPLFRQSLAWIPAYVLLRPLLVPLLPATPRRAFAIYYLGTGLLGGMNNLGGIFFHHYFVIDTFGFQLPMALCVLSALSSFAYGLFQNPQARVPQIRIAAGCAYLFAVIEIIFYFCAGGSAALSVI